jgi:hypothetical protein
MKYCCEQFAEQTGHQNVGFEFYHNDQTWSINGCCGGGCWVVTGMQFCPYCGAKLEPEIELETEATRSKVD